MQLGLRTKLTLVMTGLVFLVVVVLSAVFVAQLTSQVIHETNMRANELTQQIFDQAKHALEDAKESGARRPHSSTTSFEKLNSAGAGFIPELYVTKNAARAVCRDSHPYHGRPARASRVALECAP